MNHLRKSVALLALAALLLTPVQAAAVEGSQVLYVGGSIVTPAAETMGSLDLSDPNVFVFTSPKGDIRVRYADIKKVQYEKKRAHHLGIIPLLAVALVKKLQRKHFVQLDFVSGNAPSQSVVFEIPKGMVQTLLPILYGRTNRSSGQSTAITQAK